MPDDFFPKYFSQYQTLAFDKGVFPKLQQFASLARSVRERGRKMMFGGNGASAALAEHATVDFTKQGEVRSVTFHYAALM